MTVPDDQHARDYNQSMTAKLWLTRNPWAIPLLCGSLLALVIGNWDSSIVRFFAKEPRAALDSALLFLSLLACVASAMMILSRPRLIARWATGFITLFIACRVLPMLIGRPRPTFADPSYFISPFGQYPLSPEAGIRHAWEFWIPGISSIWSMPSREVAYAFFAVVTIADARPAWRPALRLFAALFALASLASGQHYPSDAIIGAAIGAAIARTVMRPDSANLPPASAPAPAQLPPDSTPPAQG